MRVPIRKVENGAVCLRVLLGPSLACNDRGATERAFRQWPNPSIERTSQSLLRSLWSAAHVER